VLFSVLLAGCAGPARVSAGELDGVATLRCERVIDGDTFELTIDGELERVRMLCLNTPERGKPGFIEAREFLRAKIEGREIRLERDKNFKNRDGFGRLLRYVWLDDELINASVIRAGHSTYWTKYGRSSTYEAELSR
jgi:micrococcal nuclease